MIPVPPELDVTKGTEVTPQLVYAQFLIRQGHYPEALARLDQVLAQEPNYVDALYQKGVLLSDALLRHDEALVCFDQLLAKLPDSTDALIGRGLAYAKLNNFTAAEEDFDKAIQNNPRLANATAFRGICRGNSRRFREGVWLITPRRSVSTRHGHSLSVARQRPPGTVRCRRGTGRFERSHRHNASLAQAYACRGRYYYEQHELDKALTDCNKGLRDRPQQPGVLLLPCPHPHRHEGAAGGHRRLLRNLNAIRNRPKCVGGEAKRIGTTGSFRRPLKTAKS